MKIESAKRQSRRTFISTPDFRSLGAIFLGRAFLLGILKFGLLLATDLLDNGSE